MPDPRHAEADAPEVPLPHRLVDAHHHLWRLGDGRYPWLEGPPEDPADPLGVGALQRTYLLDDLLADAAGLPLVASVHVEAAIRAEDRLLETRWLQGLADRHGFPHAIVPAVELEAADVADVLDRHLAYRNVRGVRQMLDRDPATGASRETRLLDDAAWRSGLAALGRRGLSFDLQILPSQLGAAAAVAAAHEDVPFVLNHGGYHVPRSAGAERAWRDGIRRLAGQPNVTVKLSGYDTVDPTWQGEGFDDYVLTLLDAFGVERVLFASNFPVDGRTTTYNALVAATSRALAGLGDDERDAVFCRNALRTYRIALPAVASTLQNEEQHV